jgi:hypothetical protein
MHRLAWPYSSRLGCWSKPWIIALYQDFEQLARERIAPRDIEDWPIVAVALLLKMPVWTEDRDFFGSGLPIWTTDRVELYLSGHHA